MISTGVKKPGIEKIIQALPKKHSGICCRQRLTDAECHLPSDDCFLGFMKSLENNFFRNQHILRKTWKALKKKQQKKYPISENPQ
jgi:hypothetical protein